MLQGVTPVHRRLALLSQSFKACTEFFFFFGIFTIQGTHNNNTTIGYSVLSIGGITGMLCDIRLLFQTALLTHATAIIVVHNRPSWTLKPSTSDTGFTRKIKQAGAFLDIRLLDHLIITEDGYYSFADEELIL